MSIICFTTLKEEIVVVFVAVCTLHYGWKEKGGARTQMAERRSWGARKEQEESTNAAK